MRKNKTIGSSADAKIELSIDKKIGLNEKDFEQLFNVSKVKLQVAESLVIKAFQADGEKCPRCWKWDEIVKGICPRCSVNA